MNARFTSHDHPKKTVLYGGVDRVWVAQDCVYILQGNKQTQVARTRIGVTIELDEDPGDWW